MSRLRRRSLPGTWRWTWRCLLLDVDTTMTNRPRIYLDDERRYVSITWGNPYSDPVWLLQIGPRRGRA